MFHSLFVLMDIPTILALITGTLGIALFLSTRLPKNFPPGPTPLPVIGNLLSFGSDPDKGHISLTKLSETYGPIIGLKLGSYPVVLLNSLEAIKEAFVKKDYFKKRPHYLYAISKINRHPEEGPIRGVFWTNGDLWRKSRSFALSAMRDFGMGKKSIEGKIQEEAVSLCQELLKVTGQPFDIQLLLQECVSNIICNICFGSRFEYKNRKFQHLMQILSFFSQSECYSSATNYIPLLRLLPENKNIRHAMEKLNEAYNWVNNEIEEHRKTFDPEEMRDFIDLYLAKEKVDKVEDDEAFCNYNLKKIIFDIFVSGSDTTTTSIRWILLYILHNPEVQKKCHEEIDRVIGTSRLPSLADKDTLPYMEAVIHEGMRLGSIVTLGIPHAAECDTTLGGYNIPKGTWVMTNLYSVHMSSKYFKDPEKFNPERWIRPDGKFHLNEAFVPFSIGPRVCLGEPLAKSEMFLFLTSILQRINFKMVDLNKPPSLEGKQGILFVPRKFEVIMESR